MNGRLADVLTRLYPRGWRARYGEEFGEHLRGGPSGIGASANVVRWAFCEQILELRRRAMDKEAGSLSSMAKRPGAFVPLAMSVAALALVLLHIARYGVLREADEGPTAHLWQLLMVGQMPIVAWFAVKWLRRAPRQALGVLALQAGAGLASLAPVLFFGL